MAEQKKRMSAFAMFQANTSIAKPVKEKVGKYLESLFL